LSGASGTLIVDSFHRVLKIHEAFQQNQVLERRTKMMTPKASTSESANGPPPPILMGAKN